MSGCDGRAGLPEMVRVGGGAHMAIVINIRNVYETRALRVPGGEKHAQRVWWDR